MKTTIIYLGFVVMSFISKSNAAEFKFQDLNDKEAVSICAENVMQETNLDSLIESSKNVFEINTDENSIFNPNSVIESKYVKSAKEIIAENKLITESNEEEFKPLSIETRLEDRINEDNQIIESQVSREEFPLDFEKINKSVECVKVYAKNPKICTDIKL